MGPGRICTFKTVPRTIDGVDSVYFVYWRNDKNTLSDNMRLDLMDIDIYDSDEVIDKTDVLIEEH